MKVSVIIPCYNAEEYIGQTLGSLLDQTRPADEIIVVDDGSTDRSAEIALSFGDAVTVLSKGGGGAAKARNCGADHASGDAIMFLDADDVLAPDVLEHLLEELKRNPEGVVACPWYRLEKIGSKWVKRPPSCSTLGKHQDYLSGWLMNWYHVPCSILWSRTAYKNTGGWEGYVNDDGDLMMRALAYGINLQISNKGASFYRRMPEEQLTESLSGARFTRKGREAQIYVIHKIAQILEDRGRLNDYRKPVTQALLKHRQLCMVQYPDLSERCSELIVQFGEPRYIQIALNFGRSRRKSVRSIRRMFGHLKKNGLSKIRGGKIHSAKERDEENYEEIRYGLDTWQKFKTAGKKGEVKKPSNPEVSVILPMFDDTKIFHTSLRSVLKQEYGNFEIIVIGSKQPGTFSVVKSVEDSRIRFIGSENNGDLAALRNRGLKEVKGDFVAFLDPGDEWDPAKLAKQMVLFKSTPERVGLIYSGIEIKGRNGETTEISPRKRGDINRELLLKNMIGNCSGVIIRRKVIPGVGFFDESLSGLAEQDYWLRIARYFQFDFVEEPLVRSHAKSGDSRFDSTNFINTEIGEKFSNKHQRELEREGINRNFVYKKN